MRHEKASALIELARRLAASAEGLTLDEMGEAAGVGRRTAERMRDALAQLFPQLEEVADGSAKRWRIPSGLDSFLAAPGADELAELARTAAALRRQGARDRAAVLEGLERKVEGALRAAARRRLATDVEALARAEMAAVEAGPRPVQDTALIGTIREAILSLKALSFRYGGGSRPGAMRKVTPFGLMRARFGYLVAAEPPGLNPANWRLDRISEAKVLQEAAAPPEGFSLEAYAARSFGIFQDEVEDVVLEVTPQGAADALAWRFHPSQEVEKRADGSVLVRFRAGGMRELAWHLFTWGETVRIVAPQRLKDEMTGQLARASAWHSRG